MREVCVGKRKIMDGSWHNVDAVEDACSCYPDVLVVQGGDAGGRG